ncbi:MAG: hypothetical protein QOC92_815 [Acidimicrobiaceae bacterium]|jgi:Tfp pilus assembly protein PilX
MGLIRKTFSVGTLGIVNFRSNKEKLRKAERAQRDAQVALDREQSARTAAEDRIAAAEKRVSHATAEAAKAAKTAERAKRRNRKKGRTLPAPNVAHAVETARATGSEVVERGRKAAKRARKAAKRAAADAKKGSKRLAEQASETIEQLTSA